MTLTMHTQKTILNGPLMQCLLFLVFVGFTNGFMLLGESCMAPSPCHCAPDKVLCDVKNLTSIPTFTPTTEHVDNLTILFPGNHLTVLPANAFRNIESAGATRITFLFQSNKLYAMDKDAFAGIADAVVELDLQDNKFTGFPAAFATLTNLQELHMEANPITTIDPMVSSLMSPSLQHLWMAGVDLTAWPYGLNHLRHLTYLSIYGIPVHHLPLDAFGGFGEFLTELEISGAFSGQIPSAVCFIRSLKLLTVNRMHYKSQEQLLQIHEKCRELLSNIATSISL